MRSCANYEGNAMTNVDVLKIDHIGIAVRDLEAAVQTYSRLFGVRPHHRETLASQEVEVASFRVGESTIELLEGTSSSSAISRFVARRGEGLHHVCFRVDDLDSAVKNLKEHGFQVVDVPREGVGGTRIAFVHPGSAHGVLVELVEHVSGSGAGEPRHTR